MNSHITNNFLDCYSKLPDKIKQSARKSYKLWKENPNLPGLEFKRVHTKMTIYSVRIRIGWRALGVVENNDIIWFWIGSHADYDKILKSF